MPFTPKGKKVMAAMDKEYGPEKGEKVFYASRNKGTISGVEEKDKKKHQVSAVKKMMGK